MAHRSRAGRPAPAGFRAGPSPDQPCPCGGGAYAVCCGPLIEGRQQASTAEQLMRSRYSAFARAAQDPAAIEHLLRTHPQPELAPPQRRWELQRFSRDLQWQQLEVLACQAGGPDDAEGRVRFAAHWRQGARCGVQHELSRFGRGPDGQWLYLEPIQLQ